MSNVITIVNQKRRGGKDHHGQRAGAGSRPEGI